MTGREADVLRRTKMEVMHEGKEDVGLAGVREDVDWRPMIHSTSTERKRPTEGDIAR